MTSETEKWLTKGQANDYDYCKRYIKQNPDNEDIEFVQRDLEALEALARCKALLKKHEWGNYNPSTGCYSCPNCGWLLHEGHAPDCAIAAEIAGLPREIK